MTSAREFLKIYQTGVLTVVGFDGRDVLDDINLAECRQELLALVQQYHCETIAFDLSGVKLIPSGLLGLLASLRNHGVEVHVYNPSPDIREVLEVTKLDQIMQVREVEV